MYELAITFGTVVIINQNNNFSGKKCSTDNFGR